MSKKVLLEMWWGRWAPNPNGFGTFWNQGLDLMGFGYSKEIFDVIS